MLDLKNTTALVKFFLTESKRCRNSDSFLYFMVIRHEAKKHGISIQDLTVADFLLNMKEYGFSPFESVRRARQKIQATYPELAACEAVEGFRAVNEQEFKAYARGEW